MDGKYWFPTYTIANATLHFKDMSQRIKMTVKYEDYKQFKSDTQIKYDMERKTTPPMARLRGRRRSRPQRPVAPKRLAEGHCAPSRRSSAEPFVAGGMSQSGD